MVNTLANLELVEYCIDAWKLSAYEVINIGLHPSNLVLEESNFFLLHSG